MKITLLTRERERERERESKTCWECGVKNPSHSTVSPDKKHETFFCKPCLKKYNPDVFCVVCGTKNPQHFHHDRPFPWKTSWTVYCEPCYQKEQIKKKCSDCQKPTSDRGAYWCCSQCLNWGDRKWRCLECHQKVVTEPLIDEHWEKCKKSAKFQQEFARGEWNCKVCQKDLRDESYQTFSKHKDTKWCSEHGDDLSSLLSQEELKKLLGKRVKEFTCCWCGLVSQKRLNTWDDNGERLSGICLQCQPQKKTTSISELPNEEKPSETKTSQLEINQTNPSETIYYTCPHQSEMTEPNCSICLAEVEEELKEPQNSINYSSEKQINYACPKCGITLKNLSDTYYRHNGIKTNIQKQIKTEHCKPEQIAEYQKLKENSNKFKDLIDNLPETEKDKQIQEKQIKAQKQQNFILGGILVSLVVLIGMGVWWLMKRGKKAK